MKPVIKAIIKKIYKTRLFTEITPGANRVTFKNVHNVLFCFDLTPDKQIPNLGILHAGYVKQWTEQSPTFESEYNSIGAIEKAKYSPFFIQETDNPDFILRAAKQITLP